MEEEAGEVYDPAAVAETAEAQALAEAREIGEPVEVVSLRGEAREVFATPEGTLEAREYVAPVWTRGADDWERVNLELTVRPDGSVGPKVSTVDLTFSHGGDSPLVSMVRHGRELELSWPGKLPAPRLDGELAVYPEVLPDVDLRMEAIPDGFVSLLVVKSAKAAVDPALQEVRLGLNAAGLDVGLTEDGGIEALDAGSTSVVFEAPAPLMWDSSVPVAVEGSDAPAADAPEASGESMDSDPGPGGSGNVAQLEVELPAAGDELVLTPDASVLHGEDTEYPVFIDPQFHSPRASAWTMASRHHASTSFWNFSGDEGVGYCVGWANCNSNEVKRLFYRIDTSRFAGTRVLSAEFVVRNVHSAQCTNHPVELWRTKGINSSTTWNTQTASGFWIERLR
ncbi:LamG domain-containing protein, partial [Streptomyces sp. ACA25]|nr:LamG domain-containing protein [Streptomyces sp. ACA25]